MKTPETSKTIERTEAKGIILSASDGEREDASVHVSRIEASRERGNPSEQLQNGLLKPLPLDKQYRIKPVNVKYN